MKRSTMVRIASRKGTVGVCVRRFAAFSLLTILCLAVTPIRAEPSEANLQRLAEILGSIHHLREVCGANEGALWRNKMIDLLAITDLSEEKRQMLTARFNFGFHQAERVYPVCTGKAVRETNRLLNEGRTVSVRLAADPALSSNNLASAPATN